MTELDASGFGVDVARKLVVFHRWSDDCGDLFYIALNFSDLDQVVELQFARSGVYLDVLNGIRSTVNVVGNRAVVMLESNWGHVYFQGL